MAQDPCLLLAYCYNLVALCYDLAVLHCYNLADEDSGVVASPDLDLVTKHWVLQVLVRIQESLCGKTRRPKVAQIKYKLCLDVNQK